MNIARFSSQYPLTGLLTLLQANTSQHGKVSTWKGMAAGMVVLLAHLNQLSEDESIQLLEEIGPEPTGPVNDSAPRALH